MSGASYKRMVTPPASSSNFSTNTAVEAGGVLMKQNRKLTWDTFLHSNMHSDFQEVIFKITNLALSITSLVCILHTNVQYFNKLMYCFVNFLIVLLCSLLLCFCTVLSCEDNTIQCHAQICQSIGQPFCKLVIQLLYNTMEP